MDQSFWLLYYFILTAVLSVILPISYMSSVNIFPGIHLDIRNTLPDFNFSVLVWGMV